MVLNSVADLFPVHVFLRLLLVSNVEMWGGGCKWFVRKNRDEGVKSIDSGVD